MARILAISERRCLLRRAMGLTQEELALRAGVSVRTVKSLESDDDVNVQATTIAAVMRALNVEPGGWGRFMPGGG